MRHLPQILFWLLLSFSPCLFAQTKSSPSLSENFESIPFPAFVHEIELRLGCQVYYDEKLDSVRITASFTDANLEAVWAGISDKLHINFAIDPENRVFLTPVRQIVTFFPKGYFYNEPPELKITASTAEIYDPAARVRPKPVSGLENKAYIIGEAGANSKALANLAGYVHDAKTGESVPGAAVYVENPRVGAVTDQFGYFSLTLPKGKQTLFVKAIGLRDTRRQILLRSDGKINIDLQEQVNRLKEVVISAEKTANVNRTQMGVERVDIKTIKQVPTVFGEADIMQVVLTLPGVKSVGEATTGFNVRGGAADQNLILFNGMTIFNPSHFFGFFSAFNPDVVKDIELYKSSIPARFGGRLSSVLDVSAKEGNNKKFTGTAGIGLLTSRLNIEGPLVKDQTSFVLGARTTYSNYLLDLLPKTAGYGNSRASFYDFNLLISHQINEHNSLYISAYLSHDRFNLNSDTTYEYNNRNASLKFKHVFNNRFYGVLTAAADHYDYTNSSTLNQVNAYRLNYAINQQNIKGDFTWYANARNTVEFGFASNLYKLQPGSLEPGGKSSLVVPQVLQNEQGLESALYLADKIEVSSRLSLNIGLRYSMFNYLGPHSVNVYPPGTPRQTGTRSDSINYAAGSLIKTYKGPEYRLAARYLLTDNFSVKASYNTLRQYIHLLSNTTAISPTDVWKLSDPNIQPQTGDQASLGFYQNLKNNTIELSVEAYYKRIQNYLDYKSGANLLLNSHIETDVFTTRGKAWGIEFLVKKSTGKLNGWLSYTYSRTFLQQHDPLAGEIINGYHYYPASYDKPHDVSFIGNYKFSHRFSLSLNVIYSTGRPITIPVGKIFYEGSERAIYGDRNSYRIPDYFRSDFSMNIDGNHRVHQTFHDSWTIGVYNLTARKNPYSTYFISQNGAVNGYKLSIFGTAIPFVNYNIRF